jgi:hypothetical protein
MIKTAELTGPIAHQFLLSLQFDRDVTRDLLTLAREAATAVGWGPDVELLHPSEDRSIGSLTASRVGLNGWTYVISLDI